jgi:type I restriction enzyme S subunit
MNKEKQKLIPALRFPEFKNNWKDGVIADLADTIMGNAFKSADFVSEGLQLVRMGNLYQGKLQLDRTPVFLPKSFSKNHSQFLLNPFDVLMSMTGTVGKEDYGYVIQIPEDSPELLMNQRVVKIVSKENCIKNFLLQLLKNESFLQVLYSLPGGTKQANLSIGQLKGIEILYPKNKEEQQKIANCLSSLDTLITAETEKLDHLKDHKKGLLQQLFPANGETKPQFRFPEFENDGDWEETTLNKISESIFDGTHQTPKYTEKGIPFFSVENIVSGKKNKFISKDDYLYETRNNKPEFGDVLITRIGNIGFSKIIDWDFDFSIYVTLAVIKKSDFFISKYLNGYFQSSRYQKEIRSKSLLNAAPIKINMDELRKTKILLPPTKNEQQKIADCFSSADDLIDTQKIKIKSLKNHKKGLMQQLFPNVNNLAI